MFQNATEFPYPDKICDICLNSLETAFRFKQSCERAFERLIKYTQVNNKCLEGNNAIELTENENFEVDNIDLGNNDFDHAPDEEVFCEAKPMFIDSTECHETSENDPMETDFRKKSANTPNVKVQACNSCINLFMNSFNNNEFDLHNANSNFSKMINELWRQIAG